MSYEPHEVVVGHGQRVGERGVPKVNKIKQENVGFSDFTDNADATGYVDLTTLLPAGAIPLGWKITVDAGFAGDTTAVVQVGVSGDLGRFSAAVDQSVLAAGVIGSAAPAAAIAGIGSAQTVRVTVTGGADFGSITAGQLDIELYYIQTNR